MSKSEAKKIRDKIDREGGYNPQNQQSIYTKDRNGFRFTAERIGKTKKDILYKKKYKQSYKIN